MLHLKPGIFTLPTELLYHIVDELTTTELKNLRFACSQLNNTLESLLFSQITLDTNHPQMVQDLALNHTRIGNYVRCLHIPSLALETDTERVFTRHLVPALSSLKSLTSINWTVTETDSHWAIEQVITHLSPLPTLFNLNLYLKGLWIQPIPLPFHRICQFKHLRSCAIQVDDNRLLLLIAEGLFDANKFHIESLKLDGGFDSFTDPERYMTNDTDLAMLFNSTNDKFCNLGLGCVHPMPMAPRLKELSLSQFPLRHSPSILSQLGSLKALHLDRCIPYDFWKMCVEAGIQLMEITVDHVDESFLDYLESYQGLERITVAFNGIQIRGSVHELNAERFWGTCVPRHSRTIREVSVQPKNKGRWCFSNENVESFRMCGLVEELAVGIDVDEKDDIILLLQVADSYKKLKSLTVLLKGRGLPWDFIRCEQARTEFHGAIANHRHWNHSAYEVTVLTRSEQNRRASFRRSSVVKC
ncbi:hypothetical protein E1B28_009186 [Marasmius oreades]|uniref:F-box domain-containing protein n=1 Tax=Marasmius oreades TaxID=181124 RepID=A0A9P7RZW1_9AGAR|nr:uncharacterized protein E1B28_009186 [Marasmius oreades]KAG7092874.1 hypothetical protein E1B28_009186 [Marasmius oreades]